MGVCSAKKQTKQDKINQQISIFYQNEEKDKQDNIQQDVSIRFKNQDDNSSQKSQESEINLDFEQQNQSQNSQKEKDKEKKKEGKKEKKKHRSDPNKNKLRAELAPNRARDEANYMKKVEHSLKVNTIILIDKTKEKNPHYIFKVSITYQDVDDVIEMTGIDISNKPKDYFQTPDRKGHQDIYPERLSGAQATARFWTFFPIDTYFNQDPDIPNSSNYFDQLLLVSRDVPQEKKQDPTKSPAGRKKRHSTLKDEATPSPLGRSPTKRTKQRQYKKVEELIEVVTLFDLEEQQLFKNILFHLMLQKFLKNLKTTRDTDIFDDCLVSIKQVQFLFDRSPQLDRMEPLRACIYYQNLNFQLKDVLEHCRITQSQLEYVFQWRVAYGLLNILAQCYRQGLYRLNITPSSIYYVIEEKKLKLQTFNRIKNVYPLLAMKKPDNLQIDKEKAFKLAFRKDYEAVCDLILLFRQANKNEPERVKKLKKRKKTVTTDKDGTREEYIYLYDKYHKFVDENFRDPEESILINFLKQIESITINTFLRDIFQILLKFEQQILEEETKLQNEKEELEKMRADLQQDAPIEEEKLTSLDDIRLHESILQPIEKYQTPVKEYKEMLYCSIMFNKNFKDSIDAYLCLDEQATNKRVLGLIFKAFVEGIIAESDDIKYQQQITFLEQACQVMKEHQTDSVDTLHFHVLIYLLTLVPLKPIYIVRALERSIFKQHNLRTEMLVSKDRTEDPTKAIIENRKFTYLNLIYAEHYMANHKYQEALQIMQNIVTEQLNHRVKDNMQYGYTLYLNGLICHRTLQTASAMLNLEMSKNLYDVFFPITNECDNRATYNLSTIEFHLGIVYFNLHDQDNSLRCLKRALNLRQARYDQFSNEVLEVLIQILRIYVDQEETGAALELCIKSHKLMEVIYKQKKVYKNKLFGQLQFLMAAIFDCSGALLSAVRYYQKSNQSFNVSRSNTYLKQLHIQQKIKAVLIRIKHRAMIANNLAQEEPQDHSKQGLQSISDAMRPYFNGRFPKHVKELDQAIHNVQVAGLMIFAYRYFSEKQFTQSNKMYEAAIKILKAEKKDECYGISFQQVGLLYLVSGHKDEGIKYLKFAIELHDRYLHFPTKEIMQLRCLISLILQIASDGNIKLLPDLFDEAENIIEEFRQILHWNPVKEKSSSNKFIPLIKKEGIKLAYALLQMNGQIKKYDKIKKLLTRNFNNIPKLVEIATKRKDRFVGSTKIHRELTFKRESALSGKSAMPSIHHKSRRRHHHHHPETNQLMEGVQLTDTVAIPQDMERGESNFIGKKQEYNSLSKVLMGAVGQKIQKEIFEGKSDRGDAPVRIVETIEPVRQTEKKIDKIDKIQAQPDRSTVNPNQGQSYVSTMKSTISMGMTVKKIGKGLGIKRKQQ